MNCPVARILDVVGESWTLLILRDAVIWRSRFEGFRHSLGITASVLAERLRSLTEPSLLERRDPAKGRSPLEYVPTRAGQDLLPVILAPADWGPTHVPAALSQVRTEHTACGRSSRWRRGARGVPDAFLPTNFS